MNKRLEQVIQEKIEELERRIAYLESLGFKNSELIKEGFEVDARLQKKIAVVDEQISNLRYDLQEELNRQEEVRVVEAENPVCKWGCPYPDEQEE